MLGADPLLNNAPASAGACCYPPVLRIGAIRPTISSTFNGRQFEVSVGYDPEAGRYEVQSSDLESAYVNEETGETLPGFLNRNQAFRLVPRTEGYIYAHGQWFHPRLALVEPPGGPILDFIKIFHSVGELGRIGTEKGSTRLARADEAGNAGRCSA